MQTDTTVTKALLDETDPKQMLSMKLAHLEAATRLALVASDGSFQIVGGANASQLPLAPRIIVDRS